VLPIRITGSADSHHSGRTGIPTFLCRIKGNVMNFHVNLNFGDIAIRYLLLMIVVIVGGVIQSLPVMALGVVIFLSAILGWCPVYQALGINHAMDKKEECQIHNH
jgi:hypothetical protein